MKAFIGVFALVSLITMSGAIVAEEGEKPELTVAEWVEANSPKVNDNDERSRTLAHFAAKEGRIDVLEWLKASGADITGKIETLWTPTTLP